MEIEKSDMGDYVDHEYPDIEVNEPSMPWPTARASRSVNEQEQRRDAIGSSRMVSIFAILAMALVSAAAGASLALAWRAISVFLRR